MESGTWGEVWTEMRGDWYVLQGCAFVLKAVRAGVTGRSDRADL